MEWLRSLLKTTEQVLGTTELLAAESQACVAQRPGMAPMNLGSPTNPSLASLPLSPTVCSKPLVVTVGAALDRVSGDLADCCGPERRKCLGPVDDVSDPDYLNGEYPADYGWDAAELAAEPGTFAAYRKAVRTHARWTVLCGDDWISANGQKVQLISTCDHAAAPWKEMHVEVVIEGTGALNSLEGSSKHIEADAKKVMFAAPDKNCPAGASRGSTPEWVTQYTDEQIEGPVWLEPGVRICSGGDLDYRSDSNLLHAQYMADTVAWHIALLGAAAAYRVYGGPPRRDLHLLRPGEAFDPLVRTDNPGTVVELQMQQNKNSRWDMAAMVGYYVQAMATDEGPVGSSTCQITLASISVLSTLGSAILYAVMGASSGRVLDNLAACGGLERNTRWGPFSEASDLECHGGEYPGDYVWDADGLPTDPAAHAAYHEGRLIHARWNMVGTVSYLHPEMQQDPATGPPRVIMGLAMHPGSPGGNNRASQPLLSRSAATHGDTGPVRHVFVKDATGRTMTICVHSWHDPVSTIEAHMRYKQGTPAGLHRLVFAGKTLTHSHWTLAQYGIGEGSTLEVLGRLRGGMPAKREPSGQTNGDDSMDTVEAPRPQPAANSSLQAWAKWVQGPYQALLRSAHFAQQLDEWELAFLEALTEQEIPEGAVAAMTTRAGMALTAAEATRAMAAYKGRRSLQPDFVNGVFRRVPGRDSDATIAEASPSPPAPQPHPTVLEWARWVAGPYAAIESRSTYASELDKWEVDMEEYLMEAEATQEQLAMFAAAAGMDMDHTTTVRAMGAYAARKHLRLDFQELRFKGFPPTGAPTQAEGDITSDQGRMREIVALLSAQKLEVEHMRQSMIPPLTTNAIDRFLTEALPYAWMTSLGAALKEIAMEDPSGAWAKQPLPATVWRVLNEELRAKRQGRPSAPAMPANQAAPAQCFTAPPAAPATGSGTVCFHCGQRGHIARVCPWKQAGARCSKWASTLSGSTTTRPTT